MIMVWNGETLNKHTWIPHKQTHICSHKFEFFWVRINVGNEDINSNPKLGTKTKKILGDGSLL